MVGSRELVDFIVGWNDNLLSHHTFLANAG
jgi:hypothetical protein